MITISNIFIAFIALISIAFVFLPLSKLKNPVRTEPITHNEIDNISNQIERIYEEINNTIKDHNSGNTTKYEFENAIQDYRIHAALLLKHKELLVSEITINTHEIDARVADFINEWNAEPYRNLEMDNDKNDKLST